MVAIVKPDLNRVWANGAPGANVVDPDTTTPGKFNAGWQAEVPPFEHFNFLQKLFTQGLAHNNEQGVNLWDTDTVYPLNGITKGSNGLMYRAVSEQSGNDPIADGGVNWVVLISSPRYESISAAMNVNNDLYDSIETISYIGGWATTAAGPKGGATYHSDGTTGTVSTVYADGAGFYDSTGKGFKLSQQNGLNVFQFGATGDGVTDDSTSINAAMLFSKSVCFLSGVYIAVDLEVQDNQELALAKDATLRLKAASLTANKLLNINGKSNIRIHGGVVDGNFANMAGQKPQVIGIAGNSSIIEIDHVKFLDPPDRCIGGTVSVNTITDINIHHNYFDHSGNGENAIAFNNINRTGTCKRINIHDNVIYDVVTGIRFWGCDEWKVDNNHIFCTATTANECIGFHYGNSNITITSNTLITQTQDPFCITVGMEAATDNVIINGNTMIGPGVASTFQADAIELVHRPGISCKGWVVSNNNIKGTAYGITFGFDATSPGTSLWDDLVIEGNTVECGAKGIFQSLSGSTATCTLSNLVIDNNVVTLTSNSDASVDRCIQARDSVAGIILDNAIISNNICTNGYYGIYTDASFGGKNIQVKDNIAENNVYGIRLGGNTDSTKAFSSQGNIAENNSTADYSLVNFTPVNGNIRNNDRDSIGIVFNPQETLDDTGTPSVLNGEKFITGGTTTITDFDNGRPGQTIFIIVNHAITFDMTASSLVGSSADIVAANNDTISFQMDDNGTVWRLLGYVDSSVDNSGGA